MLLARDLNGFFVEVLDDLDCQYDTKSYIVGLFSKYKTATFDLSKSNVTLTYSNAYFSQDFLGFQTLADWIFLCGVMFPEHLNRASEDYYLNIGRLSYYSCYKLINKQWRVYEELADAFEPLVEEVKLTLTTQNVR